MGFGYKQEEPAKQGLSRIEESDIQSLSRNTVALRTQLARLGFFEYTPVAIIGFGRAHPKSDPGADRHRWFAAKLFVAIVVTITAAYVTAKLLQPGRPLPCAPRMDASPRCR